MKTSSVIISFSILVLFAVSAMAQTRVIVIPMGGKKPVGVAVAADVLKGKTFSNKVDVGVTGTMENNGAMTFNPGTTIQNVPEGYHNGSGTVTGDPNLTSVNIKNGTTIFGVTGTYPLAGAANKTGQTTSYGTGDDGDLQKGVNWPNPRFTDNTDGTVTDNLTGLVWLKNAICLGPSAWATALNDSNGLSDGACGLSDGSVAGDWRLPNKSELESLIGIAYSSPALSNATGTVKWTAGSAFTGVELYYYWSSSNYASDTTKAWSVHLDDGHVWYLGKVQICNVWPVRD